ALTGVFQKMLQFQCHFINGTEKVRFVERQIYNRELYLMFDSDVGHYVGFTPYGEAQAQYRNSQAARLQYARAALDWYCRPNYPIVAPFSVERRVPPTHSQSIP
ncbi:2B11 protein, partial [Cardinalis cardinalis]|nr:2B11 protein [Cardinalis cardinalis]